MKPLFSDEGEGSPFDTPLLRYLAPDGAFAFAQIPTTPQPQATTTLTDDAIAIGASEAPTEALPISVPLPQVFLDEMPAVPGAEAHTLMYKGMPVAPPQMPHVEVPPGHVMYFGMPVREAPTPPQVLDMFALADKAPPAPEPPHHVDWLHT